MSAPVAQPPDTSPPGAGGGGQRLDKWLWFVRVVKSRTLAAGLVSEGKVRVNRQPIDKPSHTVRPGDVLTLTVRGHVRVLKVLAPGTRRGPASEAATLFEDLSPPDLRAQARAAGEPPPPPRHATRDAGGGRPTKRERRQTDRLRGDPGDDD